MSGAPEDLHLRGCGVRYTLPVDVQGAYREYPPCAALAPYVECYWTRVSAPAESVAAPPHRVLPDGCMDIVFNFCDAPAGARNSHGQRQPRGGAVVGTMTAPLLVAPWQRDDFLGVRFRPGRAPAFLRVPAAEVTDGAAPLEAVWGREGHQLEHRLGEERVAARRVALLEEELLRRLRNVADSDPYVNATVRLILESGGAVTVQRASEYAGITRQHLARRFEQYVGIRPKLFTRVVRFRNLLALLSSQHPRRADAGSLATRAVCWAALAADLHYYDQAHLISDFRQFAGMTPERFRVSR